MAYIKIDLKLIKYLKLPYKFLTIEKISKHNKLLDGLNYCILGFPEKNIKKVEGLTETGASYFLTHATNEKPYKKYNFDKNNFIILQMAGKGIDVLNGDNTTINTHFYGMSGCGLWLLNYTLEFGTNKYLVDYKLIGIITDFRKGKYFCMIANKIHLFIEAWTVIEKFRFKEIKS